MGASQIGKLLVVMDASRRVKLLIVMGASRFCEAADRYGRLAVWEVSGKRSGVAGKASACDNCKRAASSAQIPVDGIFAEGSEAGVSAACLAPSPAAESSSSSSTESVA